MQIAVDEVRERVDLALEVLLRRGAHLLELRSWEPRRAPCCEVDVADFCL